MKKALFLFQLFILCTITYSYAQIGNSCVDTDGRKFTKGDSIVIGYPTGSNSYKYIKVYYSSGSSKYYKHVDVDLCYKKIPMRRAYVDFNIFRNESVVVEVGERGLLKPVYYIEMDAAIKSGEVVLLMKESEDIPSQEMAGPLAFFSYLKLSGKFEKKNNEEFLYRFENDIYKDVRNDEFKLNSALKSAEDKIKSSLNSVDTSVMLHTFLKLNVGKYDFDKEGFPILEDEAKIELLSALYRSLDGMTFNHSRVMLNLDNFKNFGFVVISPEEAQSFIKRRKNSYGSVDRNVYAKIFFKVKGATEEDRDKVLYGDVHKVEVYEFKNFKGNILGEIYDLSE